MLLKFYLVNCLIPNIDKFNEVEEKIITNFLPNFCFKDGAHKLQQQENVERIDKEMYMGYNNSNNSAKNYSNIQLNNIDSPDNQSNCNITSANNFHHPNNNQYLQRKQNRKGKKGFQEIKYLNTCAATPKRELNRKDLISSQSPVNGDTEIKSSAETVGVKLICDTQNEELIKYFAKTVIFNLKKLEALYE